MCVCVCFTHSDISVVVSRVVIKSLVWIFVIHFQVGVRCDAPVNTEKVILNQNHFPHQTNQLQQTHRFSRCFNPHATPTGYIIIIIIKTLSNKTEMSNKWRIWFINTQRFTVTTSKLEWHFAKLRPSFLCSTSFQQVPKRSLRDLCTVVCVCFS